MPYFFIHLTLFDSHNVHYKRGFMKKGLMAGLLGLLVALSSTTSYAQTFSDAQTNWARRYIEYYRTTGIVSGSGNNRFDPNGSVTASEFATIMGRVLSQKQPALLNAAQGDDTGVFSSEFFSPDSYLYHFERIGLLCDINLNSGFASQKMTRATVDTVLNNLDRLMRPSVDHEKALESSGKDTTEQSPTENEITASKEDTQTSVMPTIAEDDVMSDPDITDSSAATLPNAAASHNMFHIVKPDWYRPGTKTLYSPDQLLTRAELMQLLYNIFETRPLPCEYKAELPIIHISQMTPISAPVGCEAVSMLMCLRYRGFAKDVTIRQYLDALPKHKNDPEIAFAGSPYTPNERLRTTIFPEPLANYGQSYGAQVVNISGADTEQLKQEIYNGNPVVVYVTLFWQKPYYKKYTIGGQVRTYLRNNHALVIAGYDPGKRQFLIVDPYNVKGIKSKYWYDEDKLRPLYEVRKHAISIQ